MFERSHTIYGDKFHITISIEKIKSEQRTMYSSALWKSAFLSRSLSLKYTASETGKTIQVGIYQIIG